MTRNRCASQEWQGVADFGHTAGFDFDLGRCVNCGADLLSVAYADHPTVHVISRAEAERRRALKRWVGE